MAAALAYLPFRVVYAPTKLVGRVVVWLAEGYRSAPPLERVLIFPSWAVLRGVFIVGWTLSLALHAAARRSVEA
ncbi:MAG TPA: hypothetical protein VGI69_11335 [Gaiellaceae bacterium]|jgi:hypothetical protein